MVGMAETAVQTEIRRFLDEVAQAGKFKRIEFRQKLRAFVKGKSNFPPEDRQDIRDGMLDFAAEFETMAGSDQIATHKMQWIAGIGSGMTLAGIGLLAASMPVLAIAIPVVGGLGVAGAGLTGWEWLSQKSRQNAEIAADLREFAEELI